MGRWSDLSSTRWIAKADVQDGINTGALILLSSAPGIGTEQFITRAQLEAWVNTVSIGASTNQFVTKQGIAFATDFCAGSGSDGTITLMEFSDSTEDKLIVYSENGFYYNGTYRKDLIRINKDGTLDTGFSVGSGLGSGSDRLRSIAVQSDGKIIIAGRFTSFNGNSFGRILRLNSNGTVDTSFNSGGSGFNDDCVKLKLRSDGKIYASGEFTTYNGLTANQIIRLNSDGSVDGSFSTGTGFSGGNGSIVIDVNSSDQILCAGSFTSYKGTSIKSLIRINNTGNLDTSFDPGTGIVGNILYPVIGVLCIYEKTLVYGAIDSYRGTTKDGAFIANMDGTLDTSFTFGDSNNNVQIFQARLTKGNKILFSGTFSNYGGSAKQGIVMTNLDGSVYTSFNVGIGTNVGVTLCNLEATDGHVYVGGDFSQYKGNSTVNIMKLKSNGDLVNTCTIPIYIGITATYNGIFDLIIEINVSAALPDSLTISFDWCTNTSADGNVTFSLPATFSGTTTATANCSSLGSFFGIYASSNVTTTTGSVVNDFHVKGATISFSTADTTKPYLISYPNVDNACAGASAVVDDCIANCS